VPAKIRRARRTARASASLGAIDLELAPVYSAGLNRGVERGVSLSSVTETARALDLELAKPRPIARSVVIGLGRISPCSFINIAPACWVGAILSAEELVASLGLSSSRHEFDCLPTECRQLTP